MINETDTHLSDWIKSVLAVTTVSLAAPGPAQPPNGVDLYLLELARLPSARGIYRAPLQVALRYLVTVWNDEPLEAHRLLGELLFAAMENEELEVDLAGLPAALWSSFGIAPRPAFVISLPLRRARPEPQVKPVLQPLVVQSVALAALHILVVGPNGVPLARAQVDLPALGLHGETDTQGHVAFSAVPASGAALEALVQARGQRVTARVDQATTPDDPLIVKLDLPAPQ